MKYICSKGIDMCVLFDFQLFTPKEHAAYETCQKNIVCGL